MKKLTNKSPVHHRMVHEIFTWFDTPKNHLLYQQFNLKWRIQLKTLDPGSCFLACFCLVPPAISNMYIVTIHPAKNNHAYTRRKIIINSKKREKKEYIRVTEIQLARSFKLNQYRCIRSCKSFLREEDGSVFLCELSFFWPIY